ncbi:MAG: SCO6745 family protein [Acidimicrobiales bacterium]
MEPTSTLARRLWEATEPIHAVVYFAEEAADAARAAGLRGFWMGYFAGRVAPLGPVPPAAVTAMTFGFAPGMVRRAIPDAWTYASPEAVVEARVVGATMALRRHLDAEGVRSLAELGDLLWTAVEGCRFEGRPLAAGWSGLPRQDDPLAAAWLAVTILREHRGDGHVLAAVAAGLRGLDATVTHVATGAMTRQVVQPARGWADDDWEQSVRRLQARGLLDRDGRLTKSGGELRRQVEDVTDRLASSAVERVGEAGVRRAIELGAPISRLLIDTRVVPVPNPAGAPRP